MRPRPESDDRPARPRRWRYSLPNRNEHRRVCGLGWRKQSSYQLREHNEFLRNNHARDGVFPSGFLGTAPGIGRRLMRLRHEDVADVEDQISRAAITNRHPMRGAQPIEHREAHAIQWDVESIGSLPAV